MKVSLITVTKNSEEFILRCINSVNSQTYSDIEHIFIDGESEDNTVEIIKRSSHRTNRVISEKDNGIYDAMNKGLSLASGDIIGFLNSDDYFYNENTLEDIVSLFDNDIGCVYGNLEFVDLNGNIKRYWRSKEFTYENISKGIFPPHPTFYFKRELLQGVSTFNTKINICADLDFMIRIRKIKDLRYQKIDKVLVKMQVGGLSTRGIRSNVKILFETYDILKNNNIRTNWLKLITFKVIKILEQKNRIALSRD